MEKEQTLQELANLEREARRRLAEIRRVKRESRPHKNHTRVISELQRSRKETGMDPETELFKVNRMLDRDDLSSSERGSLKIRRKTLLKKLEQGS